MVYFTFYEWYLNILLDLFDSLNSVGTSERIVLRMMLLLFVSASLPYTWMNIYHLTLHEHKAVVFIYRKTSFM